jgi:hypothetical protein
MEQGKELQSMWMIALRRFALLSALLVGCGGEGGMGMVGEPEPLPGSGATLQFLLEAGGDLGPLPARVGDVTVESVAFWIDRLSLSGDRGDYGEQEMLADKLLDLTAGPRSFNLDRADPALYSRLRVEFSEPGGDGIQGMPVSYRVAGRTSAGAPFVLSGRDDFQLDLRVVDGAELGAHTKVLCVVRLDMSGWWNGVLLAGNASDGSGSSGGDLHHSEGGGGSTFLDNVERSASMTLSAVPR